LESPALPAPGKMLSGSALHTNMVAQWCSILDVPTGTEGIIPALSSPPNRSALEKIQTKPISAIWDCYFGFIIFPEVLCKVCLELHTFLYTQSLNCHRSPALFCDRVFSYQIINYSKDLFDVCQMPLVGCSFLPLPGFVSSFVN